MSIVSFSNTTNVVTLFVNLKSWDERKGTEHHAQAVVGKIIAATKDIRKARILAITPPAIPGLC